MFQAISTAETCGYDSPCICALGARERWCGGGSAVFEIARQRISRLLGHVQIDPCCALIIDQAKCAAGIGTSSEAQLSALKTGTGEYGVVFVDICIRQHGKVVRAKAVGGVACTATK